MKNFFLISTLIILQSCATQQYDVIIIGGGTSGTAAGIEAARNGAKSLIIEESEWLGGMLTSAGVSATDGNYKLRGGLWAEFRDSLEVHYGGAEALKTGWVSNVMFEPSVGNRIFQNIAKREQNLTVWHKSTAVEFEQQSDNSWIITVERDGKQHKINTKIMIDATELGDVAKAVGVSYDVGMDSKTVTGENIAPEKANHIVQDLTYVAVLKDYKRDMTIDKPEGYDPAMFACCCDNKNCITPKESHRVWSKDMMITYGKLPNDKYMINWPIEGNDYYVNMIDMNADERAKAEKSAKNHTLAFLYFLQTELGFNTLYLADDEYPTDDLFPFTPYHRESRRIHGVVRFTLNHIVEPYNQPQALYRTAIGVGDYPVDQHHTRYSGWDELPDLYFYAIPSYGLPMGVMIPKDKKGLIVAEKSVSVTNIVNGSSRLQPVVLQIGQAAGILAALAAKSNCDIDQVPVRSVQEGILNVNGYLLPYLDLAQSSPHFKAMQRIGVTGIMKGRGANVGWENQSWFDADSTISVTALSNGLSEVYNSIQNTKSHDLISLTTLVDMISTITGTPPSDIMKQCQQIWIQMQLEDFNPDRPLKRIECAVVIDTILDPFHNCPINIDGSYVNQ